MAKKAKSLYTKVAHEPIFHKTSIGRNPSLCKMNKSKRKNFKKYRGQGRCQMSQNILVSRYERKNYNYKNKPNISTTIFNIVVRVKYNEKTMEVLRCRYTTVGS